MSDYWQKRQKELYSAMEKDEAKLKERLSKYYDSEYRRLDKEIAAYYTKYGTDNVIEYRNLMERLSDSDRRLLFERMDDFAAKYPQYAHLLPVRESIYKLNRLEGLQYSIRLTQLDIGAVDIAQITAYLDKQALRGLNWGKEMLGFGKNFYTNDTEITKLFVNVPWSGEDFSTRIWNDTSKLAGYLSQDFAQGIARGESYDRLTAQLQKRFGDVNRRDAYRLVFTEGTYVMAESSMHPFTDDFEYYTISALPDACDICTDIADNTLPFKISDRAAGADFPPFHPWCRCTFEIYVEDWDKWIDDYVERHGGNAEQAEKIYKNLKNDDNNSIMIQRSVGAAAKNYNVRLPDSRNHTRFVEGTSITKIKTIAGKGTNTPIRDAIYLESGYGVAAEEWEKKRGQATVWEKGKQRSCEVHWYEADEMRVDMKVVRWRDES